MFDHRMHRKWPCTRRTHLVTMEKAGMVLAGGRSNQSHPARPPPPRRRPRSPAGAGKSALRDRRRTEHRLRAIKPEGTHAQPGLATPGSSEIELVDLEDLRAAGAVEADDTGHGFILQGELLLI